MENSRTYEYVRMMFQRCHTAGISYKTVEGPNLYRDILQLKTSNRKRLDNPPYWTKNPDGSRGRLQQACTREYKIRPMDREIRRVLHERYGIPPKSGAVPVGCVEKWIGFSASEICRVKKSTQKYVRFRYPLIELNMTDRDVIDFYREHKLPIPPRSVCNACFANPPELLREMYEHRPEDWQQAVSVDEAIRDWSKIGVKNPVYVSATLKPLRKVANECFSTTSGSQQPIIRFLQLS